MQRHGRIYGPVPLSNARLMLTLSIVLPSMDSKALHKSKSSRQAELAQVQLLGCSDIQEYEQLTSDSSPGQYASHNLIHRRCRSRLQKVGD